MLKNMKSIFKGKFLFWVILIIILLALLWASDVPKKLYIKYQCRGESLGWCEQNLSDECTKKGHCID